jgi:transcriptional regulator GlxA family with amidase domain
VEAVDERLVVVVACRTSELLDVACVTSTLDVANRIGASPPYRTRVVSPGGGDVVADSGLSLRGRGSLERIAGPLDTLVVAGGLGRSDSAADGRFTGHVRRIARDSRRVASVCTGAGVLAAAGLLDGKRATTHWHDVERLAAAHPAVDVDPRPVHVRDGSVSTASGIAGALDLTLCLVEEDHGADLARWVARTLVTSHRPPGGPVREGAPPPPEHPVVAHVVDHVATTLDGDLSAAVLAARAGIGERQLVRLFTRYVGTTPDRFVRDARTRAAAELLETTSLPVAEVAARCGFRSPAALRRSFVSRYGSSPSRHRAAAASR